MSQNSSPGKQIETPLVSVIMPVLNGEKYLSEAIESVFSQTYENWHLIIVNDNSTDSTQDILESYRNRVQKITIIRKVRNLGVAKSRNEAINRAQSDWIAFLDADDIWHPRKLFEQLHLARNTGSNVVYAPYYVIDESGVVTGLVTAKKVITLLDMAHYNPIGNLTGMYSARVLGKFLQSNRKHEDYIMWRQILEKSGEAHSTSEPLAFYRKTSRSLSSQKIKTIQWQWGIYRQVFGYNTLESVRGMILYGLHNLTKIKPVRRPLHYRNYIDEVNFPSLGSG